VMNKEWTTNVANLSALNLGQKVELIVKDLSPGVRKYESHRVLAVVSRGETGEGDRLQVRSATGVLYDETFWIKILEERKLVPTRF
jgi:hypothetical protein